MKSKEELTSNVNYSESLKSQLSKRHIQLINMLDKKEPSCYADIADIIIEQTAELQQEVERLKSERDGERLQVERLMIENGVMFKALKRCREGADSLIDLIDEALNPQHDENGR